MANVHQPRQSCGRTFFGLPAALSAALLAVFAGFLLLTSGNAYAQGSVARVEHSQAKLEGLLEGLREAITGRARVS